MLHHINVVAVYNASTVEPPLMDTPYNRQPTDTAYIQTTYKCVQIDLYIKDTSLLRTFMPVPKCPLNRGSTVYIMYIIIMHVSMYRLG